CLLSSLIRLHSAPTLFPYTTLFRSHRDRATTQVFRTVPRQIDRGSHFTHAHRRHGRHHKSDLHLSIRDGFTVGIGDGYAEYPVRDRKSTRLNSSHVSISYAVFCLKK